LSALLDGEIVRSVRKPSKPLATVWMANETRDDVTKLTGFDKRGIGMIVSPSA
jgi:hypothetical protein